MASRDAATNQMEEYKKKQEVFRSFFGLNWGRKIIATILKKTLFQLYLMI